MSRNVDHDRPEPAHPSTPWLALCLAAAGAVIGWAVYEASTRNRVSERRPDSAPGRTARQSRFGDYAVVGRTVTINRPRNEIYAYWLDFRNLARFMENVRDVSVEGDLTRWKIRGPLGRDIHLETRIIDDRENEQIAWRSTENSEVDTEGKVMFRDAPRGRGTELEAILAYVPPAGELGHWIAKVFQFEPSIQGRRELRRLKMLLETGEIATASNRNPA